MIGVLIKRGILDTEKYIQRKNDMKTPIGRTSGEDRQRLQWGSYKSRNTKNRWQPPEAKRPGADSPSEPGKEPTLPTS